MSNNPPAVAARYRRNINALSAEDCAALAGKRVCIAGCGGLGGYVAEALARVGVGHLRLVDCDAFETSNLNRQLFATEQTVGCRKAQTGADRITEVNTEVETEVCDTRITEDNARDLVIDCDCVVDALDNMAARFWLAHACQEAGVPLCYGAIAGWYGQVGTVFPGDASFVTIYGSTESGGEGVQKTEGVLPFSAAATAAFQSAETVKVLLGKPDTIRNRLLMIDLLYGSVEEMELS